MLEPETRQERCASAGRPTNRRRARRGEGDRPRSAGGTRRLGRVPSSGAPPGDRGAEERPGAGRGAPNVSPEVVDGSQDAALGTGVQPQPELAEQRTARAAKPAASRRATRTISARRAAAGDEGQRDRAPSAAATTSRTRARSSAARRARRERRAGERGDEPEGDAAGRRSGSRRPASARRPVLGLPVAVGRRPAQASFAGLGSGRSSRVGR